MQRFYRPEDISADLGYRAGFWDIYASSEQEEVDVEDVQALCQVRRSGSSAGGPQHTGTCSWPGLQQSPASVGVMKMCMPCVSRRVPLLTMPRCCAKSCAAALRQM